MLSPENDDEENNRHQLLAPTPTVSVVRKKRHNKSLRKRRSKAHPRARAIGALVFVASSLYLYFLWRTQVFLDKLERDRDRDQSVTAHHRFQRIFADQAQSAQAAAAFDNQDWKAKFTNNFLLNDNNNNDNNKHSVEKTPSKYMIFYNMQGGQGTGNILNGLLAAHLFAKEFGRIVCVEKGYKSFHDVFELKDDDQRKQCQEVLAQNNEVPMAGQIRIVNFEEPPDECALKDRFLKGGELMSFFGNTYPRWPPLDVGFFNTLYRPKQKLLQALPYKQQPRTVVHLRSPDHEGTDPRRGLDEDSLMALGKYLQQHKLDDTDIPYLVTNEATWFDKMEQLFQWQHPPWNQIEHSAMGRRWGARQQRQQVPGKVEYNLNITQDLQMMVDWYTILQATRVYHTHSDFSLSAIHFNNIKESKTIMGVEEGKLLLVDESWRVDGETVPLSQRTVDGKGTSNLRLCNMARSYEALEGH